MRKISLVALVLAGCSGGGMNQPLSCRDDLEPNDSQEEARRLTPGTAVSGLKACNGEEDWYVVTLGKGEVLTLNLDLNKSKELARPSESLELLVHEPTQMVPIMRAPKSDGGFDIKAELQPGDAGDYYVHLKHVGTGVVEYDLTALVTGATQQCMPGTHAQNGECVADGCGDLGFEPNEDIAHARVLVAGKYKGLKICSGTDRDFFVLQPPVGGGAFTLSMELTGGNGDIDAFATDGTMKNATQFKTVAAAAGGGYEDYMTRVPVADGTQMFLIVAGDKMATNTYDLELVWEPLDEKRDCLMDCGAMIKMPGPIDPSMPEAVTAGYFVGTEEDYSYARRDLAMLLTYAFDAVAKQFPGTNPIYLSDICQMDGKTPGTDVNQPRHPTTTHINGRDVDIAYYSTLADNDYRIVCGDGTDKNGNGRTGKFNDGYFCTTTQNVVDWPREVYFMAQIMGSPLFRVLGVDETFPDPISTEANKQYAAGLIPRWAVYRLENGLGYGNDGGWAFHHHHTHLSLADR
jgi:hypothetical protein